MSTSHFNNNTSSTNDKSSYNHTKNFLSAHQRYESNPKNIINQDHLYDSAKYPSGFAQNQNGSQGFAKGNQNNGYFFGQGLVNAFSNHFMKGQLLFEELYVETFGKKVTEAEKSHNTTWMNLLSGPL